MDEANLQLCLKMCAVLGASAAMLYGMNRVFARLKAMQQGFGPNSLRALGIVLFIPALLLLALLANFSSETLAALLGTIAGYVLSGTKVDNA
jgi:hypothetical protein